MGKKYTKDLHTKITVEESMLIHKYAKKNKMSIGAVIRELIHLLKLVEE